MIHLVGLPHTRLDDQEFSHCAFTSKAVRLVEILRNCGESVTVHWGDGLGLSIEETVAFPWDANHPVWEAFHNRAISAISGTLQPDDIIAVVGGRTSQCVVDAFPNNICIEPTVGYEGLANGTFAAFESYAWMHHRYGALGINDGRAFDTVIPTFQRAEDFEEGPDDGYALYLGRHIARKGVRAASDIAHAAGLPLLTAGAGAHQAGPDILCDDGTVIPDATYLGALGPVDRRKVLSRASVLICPTLYIEPGANVHVEAMLSGIGVVAPDYGIFSETLPTTWRYRSLAEAKEAVSFAVECRQRPLGPDGMQNFDYYFDEGSIRTWAIRKHGMGAAAFHYKRWLKRLRTLHGDGWYAL